MTSRLSSIRTGGRTFSTSPARHGRRSQRAPSHLRTRTGHGCCTSAGVSSVMAREKPVSVVLDEVFRRGGMKRSLKRAQVVVLWTRVAGRELSRFTRARAFRDGVLFVDTSDSETAMHL